MMNDITKYVSFLLNTQDCSWIAWPDFPITAAVTLPTDSAGFPSPVRCFSGALWELRKQTDSMAESTNPPVYENQKNGDNSN